ncbi:hypothetical protein SRHO_G00169140 [Serrasalmus rhombeus]
MERRGMKVSRDKMEYMCVNEREAGGKVKMQGVEVVKVDDFKYLGQPSRAMDSAKKRQEAELEVAEMKMLRFSLGVTRMDKIRNEQIRGTVKVEQFGDKAREARLRWFGRVEEE